MAEIEDLGREFEALTAVLDSCADEIGTRPTSTIRERLSAVSREIMQMRASTAADLVWKARVLQTWVDPESGWPEEFAGLLCRDILRLYADKGAAAKS